MERTSLSLMAFCFVIERSGLLLYTLKPGGLAAPPGKQISLWIGLAFLMLGSWVACWSSWQFKKLINPLRPVEIHLGYSINTGCHYCNPARFAHGLFVRL